MNIIRLTRLTALVALRLALPTPAALQAQAAAVPPRAPSLEQRVAGLEAHLANGDPSSALKDAKGAIPGGLTMPSVGTAGPGHNGWMMTCAALVRS